MDLSDSYQRYESRTGLRLAVCDQGQTMSDTESMWRNAPAVPNQFSGKLLQNFISAMFQK
jgi:hypothetical protein